ncbi:MAG: hypothetical protein HC796_10315 [Synechococcaceae cyanobacterium RL_1_2]|nr:hypothetical protein [Synechococcaceae cyanobacterium RL_1_2]
MKFWRSSIANKEELSFYQSQGLNFRPLFTISEVQAHSKKTTELMDKAPLLPILGEIT